MPHVDPKDVSVSYDPLDDALVYMIASGRNYRSQVAHNVDVFRHAETDQIVGFRFLHINSLINTAKQRQEEERSQEREVVECTSPEAWAEMIQELFEEACKHPFQPAVFYDAGGDHLQVYINDARSFGHWVGKCGVTTTHAEDEERVIGISCDGVSYFLGEAMKAAPQPEISRGY